MDWLGRWQNEWMGMGGLVNGGCWGVWGGRNRWMGGIDGRRGGRVE